MESGQSVILPNSPVVAEPPKPKDFGVPRKETVARNPGGFIGALEVYIHHARDIHNICIYQKQDVYAKLCLTNDPETTVSTQILYGGGRNPVFNENLRLNVSTADCSLKCEIWMLSRVRNYLEDQLLGFALVPLSDVLIGNGKVAQEFSLSSTDLFHSLAGFVELSITYMGVLPEVMEIPTPRSLLDAKPAVQDSELSDSVSSEYDKIEFPDPKIVNENHMMVSEYFGIPCAELEAESSESLDTADNNDHLTKDVGVHVVESLSTGSLDSVKVSKVETPPSGISANGSPSVSIPASTQSISDTTGCTKSPNQDVALSENDELEEAGEAESSSSDVPVNTLTQPPLCVNIEVEQKVVQQDIVDMYMKSMQQFTESLAKMKLPMDIKNGSAVSGNANSDKKLQASKDNGNGSRVFYGSRAFF